MKSLVNSLLYFLLSVAVSAAQADAHHAHSKVFKITKIKPGFQLLQGKGGNILLSEGKDGLLIVDSDYSEMTPALQKALAGFERPLKYILNTHWHGDHTQGNKVLGKTASVIAHDNVYKRLSSKQEIKLFNMVSEPYNEQALPNITFDQTLTLRFNGETISLIHMPNGHTDGDSVIFFNKANIVHMGDHFFNGFFPFVDVSSKGSVRGVAANIDRLLGRIDNNTVIIPGHGPIASKEELVAFKEMLLGTSKEVEKAMANNQSLQQIQTQGLSSPWKSWGKGFLNEATWINIVYDSLVADAQK